MPSYTAPKLSQQPQLSSTSGNIGDGGDPGIPDYYTKLVRETSGKMPEALRKPSSLEANQGVGGSKMSQEVAYKLLEAALAEDASLDSSGLLGGLEGLDSLKGLEGLGLGLDDSKDSDSDSSDSDGNGKGNGCFEGRFEGEKDYLEGLEHIGEEDLSLEEDNSIRETLAEAEREGLEIYEAEKAARVDRGSGLLSTILEGSREGSKTASKGSTTGSKQSAYDPSKYAADASDAPQAQYDPAKYAAAEEGSQLEQSSLLSVVENSLQIMKSGAPVILLSGEGGRGGYETQTGETGEPELCYAALTEDEASIVWTTKNLGTGKEESEGGDTEGNRILIREIGDVDVVEAPEETSFCSEKSAGLLDTSSGQSYSIKISFREKDCELDESVSQQEPLTLIFAVSSDFSAWYEGLLYVCERSNRQEAKEASSLAERIRQENLEMRKILLEKKSGSDEKKAAVSQGSESDEKKAAASQDLDSESVSESQSEDEGEEENDYDRSVRESIELGENILGKSKYADPELQKMLSLSNQSSRKGSPGAGSSSATTAGGASVSGSGTSSSGARRVRINSEGKVEIETEYDSSATSSNAEDDGGAIGGGMGGGMAFSFKPEFRAENSKTLLDDIKSRIPREELNKSGTISDFLRRRQQATQESSSRGNSVQASPMTGAATQESSSRGNSVQASPMTATAGGAGAGVVGDSDFSRRETVYYAQYQARQKDMQIVFDAIQVIDESSDEKLKRRNLLKRVLKRKYLSLMLFKREKEMYVGVRGGGSAEEQELEPLPGFIAARDPPLFLLNPEGRPFDPPSQEYLGTLSAGCWAEFDGALQEYILETSADGQDSDLSDLSDLEADGDSESETDLVTYAAAAKAAQTVAVSYAAAPAKAAHSDSDFARKKERLRGELGALSQSEEKERALYEQELLDQLARPVEELGRPDKVEAVGSPGEGKAVSPGEGVDEDSFQANYRQEFADFVANEYAGAEFAEYLTSQTEAKKTTGAGSGAKSQTEGRKASIGEEPTTVLRYPDVEPEDYLDLENETTPSHEKKGLIDGDISRLIAESKRRLNAGKTPYAGKDSNGKSGDHAGQKADSLKRNLNAHLREEGEGGEEEEDEEARALNAQFDSYLAERKREALLREGAEGDQEGAEGDQEGVEGDEGDEAIRAADRRLELLLDQEQQQEQKLKELQQELAEHERAMYGESGEIDSEGNEVVSDERLMFGPDSNVKTNEKAGSNLKTNEKAGSEASEDRYDTENEARFLLDVEGALGDPERLRELLERERREVKRLEKELKEDGLDISQYKDSEGGLDLSRLPGENGEGTETDDLTADSQDLRRDLDILRGLEGLDEKNESRLGGETSFGDLDLSELRPEELELLESAGLAGENGLGALDSSIDVEKLLMGALNNKRSKKETQGETEEETQEETEEEAQEAQDASGAERGVFPIKRTKYDVDLTRTKNEDADEESRLLDLSSGVDSESESDSEEGGGRPGKGSQGKGVQGKAQDYNKDYCYNTTASKLSTSKVSTLSTVASSGDSKISALKAEDPSDLPAGFPANEEELESYLEFLRESGKGEAGGRSGKGDAGTTVPRALGALRGGYVPLDFTNTAFTKETSLSSDGEQEGAEDYEGNDVGKFKFGGRCLGSPSAEDRRKLEEARISELGEEEAVRLAGQEADKKLQGIRDGYADEKLQEMRDLYWADDEYR